MPRRVRDPSEIDPDIVIKRKFPPATTIEERENQLIALAIERAEQQIRDGTVSSQVLVHYLKLGSTRERVEQRSLNQKIDLDAAKVESIKMQKHIEELYSDAMDAMKRYSGVPTGESGDFDED